MEKRDLLDIILFIIFLSSGAAHLQVQNSLEGQQLQSRTEKAMELLNETYCVPNEKLKDRLGNSFFQHQKLVREMQTSLLMLHHNCGWKL